MRRNGRGRAAPWHGDRSVATFLNEFDEELETTLAQAPPEVARVLRPFLIPGGKRLRPVLTFLCGRQDNAQRRDVVRCALLGELVHCASLFHDDIIDGATSRRGRATLHSIRNKTVAVFSGAYLHQMAVNLIYSLDTDPRTHQRMKARVCETAHEMCLGQSLELLNVGDLSLSEDQYEEVIGMKTAALFELCCWLGAKATNGVASSARVFGRRFGLFYQLADDVRDIVCREEDLGKPPGSDIREGVYTLPILEAAREPSVAGRRIACLLATRRRKLEAETLAELLFLVPRTAGITRALEKLRQHRVAALASLETCAGPARMLLAQYVTGIESRVLAAAAEATRSGRHV